MNPQYMSGFFCGFTIIPGQAQTSIIRSAALAGTTLISIALIIGPLARLTRRNYIFHRRTIGVWGFTFIILHVLTVVAYTLNFNLLLIWQPLDPFINPLIFGAIAFVLFLPVYFTSTDWAIIKLGADKWKNVHRIAYFAYIFSILHYILISPRWFSNAANFLLFALTVIALTLQVLAFIKTVKKTHSRKAAVAGVIIILFGTIMFLMTFTNIL